MSLHEMETSVHHSIDEMKFASDRPPDRKRRVELKFGFILLPMFTLSTFSSMVDMIRLSGKDDKHPMVDVSWHVLSGNQTSSVASNCGVAIQTDSSLGEDTTYDYIVVVGGAYEKNFQLASLSAALLQAHQRGATIIGVCRGVLALAEAGLLTNRKCCVSWFNETNVRRLYPHLNIDVSHLFIEDGKVITCAGGAGGLSLMALLLERRLGSAYARKGLHTLLHNQSVKNRNLQPLKTSDVSSIDPRIHNVIRQIEHSISSPPHTSALAQRAGISRRQLERLFQREMGLSPAEFSRRLRLNMALHLLAKDEMSIAEIADECGFCDVGHMARNFRSAFGRNIAAIRRSPTDQIRPLRLRAVQSADVEM